LIPTPKELAPVNSAANDPVGCAVPARSKPRLLVVDDNIDNRIILARLFQRRNFDVVEVDCGMRALELIAAGSFDTFLLDIRMPDMSGLDVLRTIRSAHSPDCLPVIMVTGNNQNSDIVEALELGANDYVAKPVAFAVALARVKAQVERRRAVEALGLANAALNQANEQLRNEMTARLSAVRAQRNRSAAKDRPSDESIAQRHARSRRLRARA
jgi:DNA-binding response OmpR family regulator